ncbi:MAG: protein translocase subunit SecD [Thermoleophilaceae bacterium]
MTSPLRNRVILGLVGLTLLLAALVIIPGTPLSQKTVLGLDLRGGVELVYEARPTPKVPEVTPQAIDDAIETMRERTDALGVSEPEIQRAGSDQISIGLPDVENADRAIEQVGTTAQLQFYDWEPNLIGDKERPVPDLFEAVTRASKVKPKAEAVDVPADGPSKEVEKRFGGDQQKIRQYYDRRNDSVGDRYYLFAPNDKLIPAGQFTAPLPKDAPRNPATEFYSSCKELGDAFKDRDVPRGARPDSTVPKGSACPGTLRSLGKKGPPPGSKVVKVPQGAVVVQAERPEKFPENRSFDSYWVLEDDSELSGADIENPEPNTDQQTQEPIVTMEFTDQGRKAFAAATKREAERGAEQILPPGTPRENAFQRFAITLDNQIVSLATIDFVENPEGIDGRTGAQINGIGDLKQTQDLAKSLRIGALPIDLQLISQTQVSATLGQQALDQGLVAGGAGLLLTILFLLAFYRVLGVVAAITLVTYALFLFALVKLIPITLTLPGIAGMILTLGVAADANIVVFERIKEEAREGRSIPAAIAAGYTKALRTIIDANVVTIGVAFILFMLATAGVKGFAFTLGIGTLVSLFTAVLATSAILGSMARTRVIGSRFAVGAGEAFTNWRFDFMGASRWFFSMSGVILVVGALGVAGLGINFGIDFESGTRITTPLQQKASVDQVRDVLSPLGYGDAKIQEVKDPEIGANIVQLSTPTLEPGEVQQVRGALDEKFGVDQGDFSSSSVGPTFGAQIARTAVLAIIASLILISIYIAIRFEPKFAVPILIAVAHDVLITGGVYALVGREVTTSTVAALLTILGFSLYDTIIVFDRIRENVPRMPRATFSQIVNRSMSEVLTRSLVTNLCTLLPVVALMLFGGETLRDFAFALLVGIASGTYSSIFIASPVLSLWKEREPTYKRRRRLVMQDHDGVVPAFAEISLGEEQAAEEAEEAERGDGGLRGRLKRREEKKAEGERQKAEAEVAERDRGDVEEPAAAAPEAAPEPEAGPEPAPSGETGGAPATTRAERLARRRARASGTTSAPPPGDGDPKPDIRSGTAGGDTGSGTGSAPSSGRKKRNRSRRKGHGRR